MASQIVTTRQPFWGDASGPAAVPGNATPGTGVYDVESNWEAPLSWWSEWDTATIDVLPVPGRVRVRAKRRHRYHVKQTPGAPGATPTLMGFDPGEIWFELEMWTANHQAQFENLIQLIQGQTTLALSGSATTPGTPDKRQAATPLKVHHPGLAMYGITSLYFVEGSVPEPSHTPGVFMATLRFSEFNPIPPNTSSRTQKAQKPDNNLTMPTAFGQAVGPTAPDQNPKAVNP